MNFFAAPVACRGFISGVELFTFILLEMKELICLLIEFLLVCVFYLRVGLWSVSVNNFLVSPSDSCECTFKIYTYSKTCVIRPLKNRQNKDLYDKW